MKNKVIIAMILTIGLVVSGCGGEKDKSVAVKNFSNESNETVARQEETVEVSYGDMEVSAITDEEVEVTFNKNEIATTSNETKSSRKFVDTYYYDYETLEFEASRIELDKVVKRVEGYYEHKEVNQRITYEGYEVSYGEFIIRIPKNRISSFHQDIRQVGNKLSDSFHSEDVTNQYIDMNARIRSLEIQQERLLSILEKAEDLTSIIELERALSETTYELEKYQSNLNLLKNKVEYTTVHVSLEEVVEETVIEKKPETFSEKVNKGFSETVEDVRTFFESIMLYIITKSPVLLLYAVIVVIIVMVIKRWKNRKKKDRKQEEKTEEVIAKNSEK